MLQKLLCWLLGHKTMWKAFTGHYGAVDTAFDRGLSVPICTWQRSEYCLRCGKKIHWECHHVPDDKVDEVQGKVKEAIVKATRTR